VPGRVVGVIRGCKSSLVTVGLIERVNIFALKVFDVKDFKIFPIFHLAYLNRREVYNLLMNLHSLVALVVGTFFWILPTSGQTDRTGINLVEEFKHSRCDRVARATACEGSSPASAFIA